ncbi:MAG TPA: hypothetical protein VF318_00760 [Dehalococcoidales bacterium]|jgi:hypothetical protein
MASTDSREAQSAAEIVGSMFKDFGNTISEILEDPELKEKAKDLASALAEAAMKVAEEKVTDQEVRSKLRNVGKATRMLGEKLEKHFNQAE